MRKREVFRSECDHDSCLRRESIRRYGISCVVYAVGSLIPFIRCKERGSIRLVESRLIGISYPGSSNASNTELSVENRLKVWFKRALSFIVQSASIGSESVCDGRGRKCRKTERETVVVTHQLLTTALIIY